MNKKFLLSLTLLGLMVYDPLMASAPQAKPRSKAARAWAKHRKWVIPTATALGLLAVGGGAYALHWRQRNGHTSAVQNSLTSSPGGSMVQVDSRVAVHQPAAMVSAPGRVEDRLAGAPEGADSPLRPVAASDVARYGKKCWFFAAKEATILEALSAPFSFDGGTGDLQFYCHKYAQFKPAVECMMRIGFEPIKYYVVSFKYNVVPFKYKSGVQWMSFIFVDWNNRTMEFKLDGSRVTSYPKDVDTIYVLRPFIQKEGFFRFLQDSFKLTQRQVVQADLPATPQGDSEGFQDGPSVVVAATADTCVQPVPVLDVPRYCNQCTRDDFSGTMQEALAVDSFIFKREWLIDLCDSLLFPQFASAIALMAKIGFAPVKYFVVHIAPADKTMGRPDETIIFLDKDHRTMEFDLRDGSPIVDYLGGTKKIDVYFPSIERPNLWADLQKEFGVESAGFAPAIDKGDF